MIKSVGAIFISSCLTTHTWPDLLEQVRRGTCDISIKLPPNWAPVSHIEMMGTFRMSPKAQMQFQQRNWMQFPLVILVELYCSETNQEKVRKAPKAKVRSKKSLNTGWLSWFWSQYCTWWSPPPLRKSTLVKQSTHFLQWAINNPTPHLMLNNFLGLGEILWEVGEIFSGGEKFLGLEGP